MPTNTTFMGLPNPTVGADASTWGGYLNTCINGFDALAVYNTPAIVVATGSLGVYNGPALIRADATSGNIILTLPNSTTATNKGRSYTIVKIDSSANTVTLQGFGGQTISGQGSVVLSAQWATVSVQLDGTNVTSLDDLTEGGGTVTSVAMTGDGTVFNSVVPGSPITVSGTLAPTLIAQANHTVLAGPTSGGPLAPTFRQLSTGDLSDGTTGSGSIVLATTPSISAPTITGHPTIEGVASTGATGTGNLVFGTAPTFVTSATSPAFISSTTSPASTGQVRLANGDFVAFRNSGDTADVTALSMTTDTVVLGDSNGVSLAPSGHVTVEGATSTGATGTGKFVFDTSPSLTTPTVSALTVTGKITSYNGQTTAGNGVSSIVAATSQKSETAADATVVTFTPPASAGSYKVRFVMSVSAASAATLGWSATWTDSNGNAQTPTNLALFQSGTAAPALTFTTSAAGTYYAEAQIDTDNSGTPINVQLTFSGTSFAALVSATIERVI